MESIERKLAQWHQRYRELQEARRPLDGEARQVGCDVHQQWLREVEALERATDDAADEVIAAIRSVLPPDAREKLAGTAPAPRSPVRTSTDALSHSCTGFPMTGS